MDQEKNQIQIFENPEFGEVRTLLDEKGDVLFCAKDVAIILGYSNFRDAISRHCKGVVKHDSPTSGGLQELSWIYEPDVYRLTMKSKLPAAEKFESWVFTEVLPAIRKHGMYFTQDTVADIFNDPYKFKSAMDGFLAEYEKNKKLEKELAEAKPKVEYYDTVIDTSLLTNFRNTAKELEVKPTLFIQVLLAKGYLYRSTTKDLYPYQKHMNAGLFQVKEFYRNNHGGTYTLVTPRGREHFMKLFKSLTEEELWEIQMIDV